MNRLIRLGIRQGWRRGILEGRRTWLVLGAVALSARALQRLAGRSEDVVYREELGAGSGLLITNLREDRGGNGASLHPASDRLKG
jgi:hypothetical protein